MNTQNPAIVLITGGLSGIGRATALEFAAQGASVIVVGRRDAAGRSIETEMKALGSDAAFVRADVSNETEVAAAVAFVIDRFGRLDVAVNCAGIEGATGQMVARSADEFKSVFDTNVLGTFLCMKHELVSMQAKRHGSIVNLSSTMGSRGAAGASLYVASKHAVEGFTKTAAIEAAPFNVRVNAVAPGPIDTEMLTRFAGSDERKAAVVGTVPMKRAGRPEEVARVIAFIASENASFITGQIVGVNGGRTAL